MSQNKFSAVWHCFSENKLTAIKALNLGLMLSFTSILSPEVVKEVPLEKIMIETDSPYLVPQEAKALGVTVNEPQYVKMIASKIADIKGVSIDEVEKITSRNAYDFFHLNSHD
jgi:TatD DNase family protein